MVNKLIGALLAITIATSGIVGAIGSPLALQEPNAAPTQEVTDDHLSGRIVIHGNVAPGNEVAITATLFGEPLSNADIEINDQFVGETGANGTLRNVTVPAADEFEIDVESENADLKLELEDAALQQSANRERTIASIRFDGNLTADATVTADVMFADASLGGATVEVNGDEVGVTNESGQLSFTVPAEDEFEFEAKSGDGDVDMELELEGSALQRAGGGMAAEQDEASTVPGAFDVHVSSDTSGESVRVIVSKNGSDVFNQTIEAGEHFESEFEADGTVLQIEVEWEDGDTESTVEVEQETRDEDARQVEEEADADEEQEDRDENEVEDEFEDNVDEFEGSVRSIDTSGNTVTLEDGTVIHLTANTTFDDEGDLHSLQAVADAVANDRNVRVEGGGRIDDGALEAQSVKFEVDDDAPEDEDEREDDDSSGSGSDGDDQ